MINDEWNEFIANNYNDKCEEEENIKSLFLNVKIPEASDIYISTKSKIAYLKNPINLNMFWDIPIIEYGTPTDGIIKKQIKINSSSQDELDIITEKLKNVLYFDEQIITNINNPGGRIKFKDIRKITIGISKKDLTSYRSKKKQAFYNCFVIILRIKILNVFKEFHVKVFNTGKLEIPGIQNDHMLEMVLLNIIKFLQPYSIPILNYETASETVLINSNFNCGFYINREKLYDILKYKYNIQAIFDPCSYPGIQCKFYFDKLTQFQTGIRGQTNNSDKHIVEVSFMIFRTGSVLIVGMCGDDVLMTIYNFVKTLLKNEFYNICQKIITKEMNELKNKKRKIRKKLITVSFDSIKSLNI